MGGPCDSRDLQLRIRVGETISERRALRIFRHSIMGLLKKFGPAAGPVLLGRNHVQVPMRAMPDRVAAVYGAAGAAAGAPEITEYDAEVSIRKRAPVHVVANVDK